MSNVRVSTAFHETFALSLPSISGILELAISSGGNFTDDDIKSHINLGNNYIKAMPRYARASGLLQFSSYKPTRLGETIAKYDPNLKNLSSLWLMHYHLSAPHGPGPAFWNYAITNLFRISDDLTSVSLGKNISDYIISTTGGNLKERTTKDAASVILRTYSKSDSLGRLGIVKESDENIARYTVVEPEAPSSWVIGYALADYWEGVFGDRTTVNLSEITSSAGFLSLFFMGPGLLSSKLSQLQADGLLQVQRVAPPYQVIKLWPDKYHFLENIYG
jgi:hypothetical protein